MQAKDTLEPIFERPTKIQIDLGALADNFRTIKARVGKSRVMAVVKANAYGHGLVPCAEKLIAAGADYLGVALLEEGIELRQAGITAPILVFGGILGEQIKLFIDYDLELTASSISKLQAIDSVAAQLGKVARVHLKIDTGMERIGVHYYNAAAFFEESLRSKHCQVVGVFSHFASADSSDLTFANEQLNRFLESLEFFSQRSLPMPIRHIANSGAVITLPESHLDMVRPGIALFGVAPSPHLEKALALRPVMSLVSKIVYFKVVKAGAGVSYGHTWKAQQDTRVVTIPIGYGDGYPRRLSNCGQVLIRGKRFPIIGKVCMDQIMVDLGPEGEAYNGDEVVLIGAQDNQSITVTELAKHLDTVPHEILVSLNLRLPRTYLG